MHGILTHLLPMQGALQAEHPELLVLLRQKLLPVLAAGFAPFTPGQLTGITGEDKHKVSVV